MQFCCVLFFDTKGMDGISSVMLAVGILLTCCCKIAAWDTPLTFDMTKMCGDKIELGFSRTPHGRLTFISDNFTVTKRESCVVIIKPGLKRDHIGFKFEDVQLSAGICLTIHERYDKYDESTSPIAGMHPWFCHNSSVSKYKEYHTDQNKELVVTVDGKGSMEANISILFVLYNVKEVTSECRNYTCDNGFCSNMFYNCSYGYTPCDLHNCISRGSWAYNGRGLSLGQILGISLGVLLGLVLCLCKVFIRSSYIKEDIVNRLASHCKIDGNGSKLHEDLECNGMNRLVSIAEKPELSDLSIQQQTSDSDKMLPPECTSEPDNNSLIQQNPDNKFCCTSLPHSSQSLNRDQNKQYLQNGHHIVDGLSIVLHDVNKSESDCISLSSLKEGNGTSLFCDKMSQHKLAPLPSLRSKYLVNCKHELSKSSECVEHRNGDTRLQVSISSSERLKARSFPEVSNA